MSLAPRSGGGSPTQTGGACMKSRTKLPNEANKYSCLHKTRA